MNKNFRRFLTVLLTVLMLSTLMITTAFAAEIDCSVGLFSSINGRIDQWRIGLESQDISKTTTAGAKFTLPDDFNDKFLKNATITFNYLEKSEVPGHIYEATIYPMTTEWPEPLGFDAQGKNNPWPKAASEYETFPNVGNLVPVATISKTAVANNSPISFSFDITADIINRSETSKELAYVFILKRPSGAVSWDEKYCVYINSNNIKNNVSGIVVFNYSFCETDEEISQSVKYMSKSQIGKYIKHFKPDSVYFQFADTSAIDDYIMEKNPQTIDDVINALNEKLISLQVETSPYNGEKEVSLKTDKITVNASVTGENKQPVTDGVFVLKDSLGTVVSTEFENGVVTIKEPLKDEEEYTLSWSGITGIINSTTTFKTTGKYVYLDTNLSNNAIAIEQTTEMSVNGEFQKSKTLNLLPNDKITVSDFDDTVLSYENGSFTALKRGVTDVKFSFTNEDSSVVSMNKKIVVYNKKSDIMTTDFNVEYIIGNITASNGASFTAGENAVAFSDSFTHQLFIDLTGVNGSLYIDGEKKAEADKATLTSLTFPDGVTVSDLSYLNVNGEKCYVDFVTARNVNEKLVSDYTYYDKDDDSENGTVIKWLCSVLPSGSFAEFSNEKEVVVSSDLQGKYVRVEITPKNIYETGDTVASDVLYIPAPTYLPSGGSSSGGGSYSGGSSVTINQSISDPVKNEVITDNKKEETVKFDDVSETHWAYNYISDLAIKKVLTGISENIYMPEKNVTRAEFACALAKALKIETASHSGTFSDVNLSDWYTPYVEAIYKKGIANGFEDATFRPDENITREQLCVMVANAIILSDDMTLSFADSADISDWAKDSVSKMVKAGIVNGRDGNVFAPKALATRAEMAKIISLMLKEAE